MLIKDDRERYESEVKEILERLPADKATEAKRLMLRGMLPIIEELSPEFKRATLMKLREYGFFA